MYENPVLRADNPSENVWTEKSLKVRGAQPDTENLDVL